MLSLALLSPFAIFSQPSAEQQKTVSEQHEKISRMKVELIDAERAYFKKRESAGAAIKAAEELTEELNEARTELAKSPGDKALDRRLKKVERDSKKADQTARKANEELAQAETQVTELKETIKAEESKFAVLNEGMTGTSASYGMAAEVDQAVGSPALSGQVSENTPNQPAGTKPENQQMIQKIVEDSYKNYPQQPGQPNIIINNIIVPSEQYTAQPAPRAAFQPASGMGLSPDEMADFRAWRAERYQQNTGNMRSADTRRYDYDRREYDRREYAAVPDRYERGESSSFRDRFAELPKRKSGLWVIPMVGAHASSFDVDFDDRSAQGRGGWNAGLDFRAHFNRFFIQPGAHYFSSSMDLSGSDTLSTSTFTSGPRIHSIRVPVLAGVYLTKAQGAFFKFNIKGGIVGNYVVDVDDNDRNFTIDDLERYSYGVNGGFGLEFGFVTIDLSHEWGISRFFRDGDGKNNMLRATIGFKL